jgi:F-type H+-transporting ATPase subunit delta
MNKLIAKKYAKALMESGDDATVSKRLKVLAAIGDALIDANVKEFITSPLVEKGQKAELLLNALESGEDEVISNLIKLMTEKGRLDLIPDLVAIVTFERKKASNRFEGVVYTDETLSKSSMETLEKSLAQYSGAKIHLDQARSQDGGLKVEVEDLGIELSFSRDKVKHALIDHIQKAL